MYFNPVRSQSETGDDGVGFTGIRALALKGYIPVFLNPLIMFRIDIPLSQALANNLENWKRVITFPRLLAKKL